MATPAQQLPFPEDARDVSAYMRSLGEQARAAAPAVARASTGAKNDALVATAAAIEQQEPRIAEANGEDLARARERNLSGALIDRLELTPARIQAMADGLRQVAALPDPIGEIQDLRYRPSGIQVGRMRVPLGVIGIIYESRPNVTADAAALCLKSGNATMLRGGSEAIHSNQAIAGIRRRAAGRRAAGAAVQVVEPPTAPRSASSSP